MKKRVFALLLALLLLTGCAPKMVEEEPAVWDGDIGTCTDNLHDHSIFAMADGMVYISLNKTILEYDMETGTSIEYPMPAGGGDMTVRMSNGNSMGNLFLLDDRLMFELNQQRSIIERDSLGKAVDHQTTILSQLAQLDPDSPDHTVFPEFGERIWNIIPIHKQNFQELRKSAPDNLFAGFDFYVLANHDTFPEIAAELAQDGIMLEELVDEEERGKYIITVLWHVDGDTGKRTELARNIQGYYVSQTHIYYAPNTLEQILAGKPDDRFVSERDHIDFQPLDPALGSIGFCQGPDGLYFVNAEGRVCRYRDGVVTPTAVVHPGVGLRIWKDQALAFVPVYGDPAYYDHPWIELWIYDLNTGEGRMLADHCTKNRSFSILQDRYLAYEEYDWEYDAYILLDLETGERLEMHRINRTEKEIAKEKEIFERSLERAKERAEQE